ncbi:MAG TPA: PQQ-binding-like beta-propeller repeat protein [Pilimelia sp.]|nr:PQQ-binding-like beta-propeller repeat protein [Pilimelia sp.]
MTRAVRLLAIAAAITLLAGTGSATAATKPTNVPTPPDRHDVVLIGNSAAGTVSLLDGHTFANLGTFNAIPDLRQRLDEMDLVERAAYEVIRLQKGGDRFVDDVAVAPDGRTLFVSRSNLADFVAFDLVTGAQLWRFEVDGHHADHIAISPDGSRLVISATTAGRAHVLDTRTGAEVGNFATGTYPHGNDYSHDGQRIYNASIGVTSIPKALEFLKGPRRLTVVDTRTLRTVRTYDFDHGIRPAVILPDETLMYAQLSYLNGFVEYDLTTGRILRTVNLPFSDAGRALHPDQYPQNSAHHGLAMSGDGSKLCSAGTINNYVAIVSRPALTTDRLVPSGELPYWATTSLDGAHCLVTNSKDDTVSVISYATAQEVKRVTVGDFPQRERLAAVTGAVLDALS